MGLLKGGLQLNEAAIYLWRGKFSFGAIGLPEHSLAVIMRVFAVLRLFTDTPVKRKYSRNPIMFLNVKSVGEVFFSSVKAYHFLTE